MQQTRGLQYFPIALFASVMGFAGFTIVLNKLETIYEINHFASYIFLLISTLLFLLNISILLYRLIRYKQEVKKDFNHPVKMNFFAAMTISLLLLAIPYYDISQNVSRVVWSIGAILHLSLTLFILSKLMKQTNFKIDHFTPAWFIPIVGNIVVPIAGVHFVNADILWMFYGVGVIFSIIYMTIFFNRVFFHSTIPEKLLPTLFILMVPPSIGSVSYIKLIEKVDSFVSILYGIAFFIGLLLIVNLKMFIKIPFSIS